MGSRVLKTRLSSPLTNGPTVALSFRTAFWQSRPSALNGSLRTSFLFSVGPTFVIMFLRSSGTSAYMADHVPDHAPHVIVERPIDNLLAASLGLHESGRFQEP